MEEWEKQARNDMYEIDRILNKFWVEGWMMSDDKQKILNDFPPRLKNLLIG